MTSSRVRHASDGAMNDVVQWLAGDHSDRARLKSGVDRLQAEAPGALARMREGLLAQIVHGDSGMEVTQEQERESGEPALDESEADHDWLAGWDEVADALAAVSNTTKTVPESQVEDWRWTRAGRSSGETSGSFVTLGDRGPTSLRSGSPDDSAVWASGIGLVVAGHEQSVELRVSQIPSTGDWTIELLNSPIPLFDVWLEWPDGKSGTRTLTVRDRATFAAVPWNSSLKLWVEWRSEGKSFRIPVDVPNPCDRPL